MIYYFLNAQVTFYCDVFVLLKSNKLFTSEEACVTDAMFQMAENILWEDILKVYGKVFPFLKEEEIIEKKEWSTKFKFFQEMFHAANITDFLDLELFLERMYDVDEGYDILFFANELKN